MKFDHKIIRQMPKIAGVLFLLLGIYSCDNFLQTNPKSSIKTSNFYKTQDDFKNAVNGTYATFQNLFSGSAYYCLVAGLRADNTTELTRGGGGVVSHSTIDQFKATPTNDILTNYWQTNYRGIYRANKILATIVEANIDPQYKKQYKGEAETLRAYFYFNLVRAFGKVQLVRKPKIDINTARVSVDSVYALIISDLKDAQENLPLADSLEAGRASRGTARSLLGTVYLTRKKYAKAEKEFQKVVNSGQYHLLSNYSDLFKDDNQGNAETVWAALFSQGHNNGSNFPNWFAPNITGAKPVLISTGNALGIYQPTIDIEKAYKSADVRKNCISDGFTNDEGKFIAAKYIKCYVQSSTGNGSSDSPADWYIIRYANVLLRYAEALNETGQTAKAYPYINKVRERAGLNPLTPGLSQSAFRKAIYLQERLESPFEGHRWWQLLRTGRALKVMNSKIASDSTTVGVTKPIQKYQLLYPVPERVVTVSGVQQNPGY